MIKILWTKKDVGCYADGGFGHQHCRDILGSLLCGPIGYTVNGCRDEARMMMLKAYLNRPMSDDASEEDEAIDILNEHCESGIHFALVDGDLMLVSDDVKEGE